MLLRTEKLPHPAEGAFAGTRYLGAIFTYMRVQIDRFEDGEWAVVLPYPDGGRTFDVPRDLFPKNAAEGDVFALMTEFDRGETKRLAEENRRLLDGLAGGER